jgi:hypothetical protein
LSAQQIWHVELPIVLVRQRDDFGDRSPRVLELPAASEPFRQRGAKAPCENVLSLGLKRRYRLPQETDAGAWLAPYDQDLSLQCEAEGTVGAERVFRGMCDQALDAGSRLLDFAGAEKNWNDVDEREAHRDRMVVPCRVLDGLISEGKGSLGPTT